MKDQELEARLSRSSFANIIGIGTRSVALVALFLFLQGCGGDNESILTIHNQAGMKVELHSDIFEGGVEVMPSARQDVTVRPFRESVRFWYFETQGGQEIEMLAGQVIDANGEPMWIERSTLSINSDGALSLFVSEADVSEVDAILLLEQ